MHNIFMTRQQEGGKISLTWKIFGRFTMTIERVLVRLIRVLQLISHTVESKKVPTNEVLGPLLYALSETCTYFKSYAQSERRDEFSEEKLVKYWDEAAAPLSLFDPEFSIIFQKTENYCWLTPSKWRPDEANAIATDLEIIRDKCRVMLIENSSQ